MMRLRGVMSRQSGVAIIAALMVAALVASVAGLLMLRQQRALQQLEIRKDTAEARAATWSVLQLVRLTLRDDARLGQPDHQRKPWAVPIPEIKIENGGLSGRLTELNGRFNLNNLRSSNGEFDPAALAAYRALLANLGLPANLADSLQTAWQERRRPRTAGAANPSSASQPASAPASAAGSGELVPWLELNDLQSVPGYSEAIVRQLAPYMVTLPGNSTLNVNFASAEVLAAWLPKLGVSGAEQVLAKRRSQYFNSVDEFVAALPVNQQADVPRERLAVKSDYFWADLGARFGVVFLQHRALLDRGQNEMPTVHWLRREYGPL